MPGPQHSELELKILDAAAGLFAKHGFDHTSIQAIADRVGYSKTGLLHHFPSKDSIWDGVVSVCVDIIEDLKSTAVATSIPFERDKVLVERTAAQCANFPGFTSLLLGSVGLCTETHQAGAMTDLARSALQVFGVDEDTSAERHVRVASALGSISLVTLGAIADNTLQQMRPHIEAVALETLGHHSTSPTEALS